MSDRSEALLRDLHAHTRERLASYQMPERWYVLDAIPRTSRGKVNRETVADLCRNLAMVDWRKVLR
jgi:acyl-coenzyme A synthetase/AMP-(fatty) acid ligase